MSAVVSMATSVLVVYIIITDNQAGTQPSHPVRLRCIAIKHSLVTLSDCGVGSVGTQPTSQTAV